MALEKKLCRISIGDGKSESFANCGEEKVNAILQSCRLHGEKTFIKT